jgi:hypothetical protein
LRLDERVRLVATTHRPSLDLHAAEWTASGTYRIRGAARRFGRLCAIVEQI